MDTTAIEPVWGLTWKIRTTSERCPDTLPAPVCAATAPDRPARESEPITRTLKGLPGTSGVQTLCTTPQKLGFCAALYLEYV
jgi:hypothetical protein